MLVLTPISSAVTAYYFAGQGPGRWVGQGADALELSGVVERPALEGVLRGCDPRDGRYLPAHKPARRRAGWDLVMAAPKSVSLLGGLSDEARQTVTAAQRAAVDDTVVDFEHRLLRVRRAAMPGGETSSVGMVAAAFEHESNASGEPHLHTHLLLINLGRDPEGVWSAISPSWWTARRSVGAVYQLGLRHQLGAAGLELDWKIRPDGLADLADVPRAAIRSASSRGRAAAADYAAFADSESRQRSRTRAGATIQTRRSATRQPWQARTSAAGFGSDQAAQVFRNGRFRGADRHAPATPFTPATARAETSLPDHDLSDAVTAWLAAQRSSFRQSDVVVALAACAPIGMPARSAREWTERFCDAAIPVAAVPGTAPRWTTPAARAADQLLLDQASRGRDGWEPAGRVGSRRHPLGAEAREMALARHPNLSPEARTAVRELWGEAGGMRILQAPPGRANLLAQASVLEAAATGWRAAGMRVAVATSDELSATRWRALTGIEKERVGRPVDVVLVDNADRRTTPDLLSVLAGVNRAGGEAILVEGGTRARLSWMRSDALAWIGDQRGRLDPGPAPRWAEGPQSTHNPSGQLLEATDPGVVTYPTSGEATHGLLATWADAWSASTPAVLVGLGYAETDGLNQAARTILVRRGEIAGPSVCCHGTKLQAGDRMVALRRLAPDLPRGTALQITGVDSDRRGVTVRWAQGNATLGPGPTADLGYGYAVTPALAAQMPGRLIVLGPPEALGPHRSRVAIAAVVTPGPDLGLERARTASRPLGQRPELDRDRGPDRSRGPDRDRGLGLG